MEKPSDETQPTAGQTMSMHANVQVWEDCCCCEGEPYWEEALARADQNEPQNDQSSPSGA